MDKLLLSYFSNESNVVEVKALISREKTDKGMELIHISVDGKEVYSFWYNPVSEKKVSSPKNTGGKKPYVMLMVEKLEELRESGTNNVEEAIGFLVLLSDNIEWHTGRLINKRSKKSLKYADLLSKYSNGKYRFEKLMKLLSDNNLLEHKPEGYFISRHLIKKGKERVRE